MGILRYCPHCKSLLRIVLVSREGGYDGFTRWCYICQLDPFPAYDPGDALEQE